MLPGAWVSPCPLPRPRPRVTAVPPRCPAEDGASVIPPDVRQAAALEEYTLLRQAADDVVCGGVSPARLQYESLAHLLLQRDKEHATAAEAAGDGTHGRALVRAILTSAVRMKPALH